MDIHPDIIIYLYSRWLICREKNFIIQKGGWAKNCGSAAGLNMRVDMSQYESGDVTIWKWRCHNMKGTCHNMKGCMSQYERDITQYKRDMPQYEGRHATIWNWHATIW